MLVFFSDVTFVSPMGRKKTCLNSLMDYGPRYKLFTFLLVNQNKLEIILKKNSVLTLYFLSTGRLEEGGGEVRVRGEGGVWSEVVSNTYPDRA